MITTKLEVATLDGGRVRLTAEQLTGLDAQIAGEMLLPGDRRWDDAVSLWNSMVARTPALVIQPATALDVSRAVRFAAERGLLLTIRGRGHNIAGTAVADRAITLDMSRMCGVSVDPQARLATVGPGCTLGDVDRATQEHGLATVFGFFSEVGVAGLTLGGGLGYLTRRFGWAVDNLEEVEIVTADGEIRTASRTVNSDLFWAIRGGGGNLGVVTRFTFRLHPVGPTVFGGLIGWPFERADEILEAYRALTESAPPELAVWLVLMEAPPAPFVPAAWHHERLCAMAVCYSGDLARTDEALRHIRALGDPVFDLLAPQPYTQVQSYLDAVEPRGLHYYWKTEYLPELSRPLLSTMKKLFTSCPSSAVEFGILHIDGALNTRAADDGAVGNRGAHYFLVIKGMWQPGDANAGAYQQWIRDAWKLVRPFSTGATYINFQSADEDDARVRATYGANFERLVQVKAKYDPRNLFRVNRNIRG